MTFNAPKGDILTIDPVTGASSVLVGGPTVDGYPAVSLDGTRVAFVRETSAGQELFAIDVAGRDPLPLTGGSLQEIDDIAWSPNGTFIAFVAVEGNRSNLWIARSDGSDAHRIDLGSQLAVALPQWRPPNGDELLLVGSTSSAEALLPEFGYRDLYGAFEEPTASGTGLYLVNADGSDFRSVTPATGSGYDYGLVAWTPAGDLILTQTMDPAGYIKVRVLRADGSLVRTIEPTSGVMTVKPVVAPDGRRVAYADMTPDERWTIRTEALDGSGESTVTGATFQGSRGRSAGPPMAPNSSSPTISRRRRGCSMPTAARASERPGPTPAPTPGSAWRPDSAWASRILKRERPPGRSLFVRYQIGPRTSVRHRRSPVDEPRDNGRRRVDRMEI